MHAYLITGSSPEKRNEKAKNILVQEQATDILTIETGSKHSIDSVRDLNKLLSISPFQANSKRGILFRDVHLLTDEAANAFLKTLEEPQAKVVFVLTANNEDSVLDTIKSRTLNIDLGSTNTIVNTESINSFKQKSLGERLTLLETFANREQALAFCDSLLQELHTKLVLATNNPDFSKINFVISQIKNVEQTKHDLQINVNVKLALGDLFLTWEAGKQIIG